MPGIGHLNALGDLTDVQAVAGVPALAQDGLNDNLADSLTRIVKFIRTTTRLRPATRTLRFRWGCRCVHETGDSARRMNRSEALW